MTDLRTLLDTPNVSVLRLRPDDIDAAREGIMPDAKAAPLSAAEIIRPGTADLTNDQIEATLQPVERATMLPPRAFVDPEVLDWELEKIFRGWICVGHASRVAEPGSYMMREIGPR